MIGDRMLREYVAPPPGSEEMVLAGKYVSEMYISEAAGALECLGVLEVDARIHPTAYVSAKAIIGDGVTIGPCAQIHEFSTVRGGSVIGAGVTVGFGCEVTRSVICAGAQITHQAYVGNSIVGYGAHVGAGVCLAATGLFEADMGNPVGPIRIRESLLVSTTLPVSQFGCVLGNRVRVGMGAELGPGVLVGSDSVIYPSVILSGLQVDSNVVVKRPGETYVFEPRHPVDGL